MRTWSTAARTRIGMSTCAHLAHGDRWPCSCFRHMPTMRNAADRARISSVHRRCFRSRTCDDGATDQDVAVAPNLDRRECPMRAPARQPTIPPFPIGGNSTVLVRGARVKDLIRPLGFAPGRRRGCR